MPIQSENPAAALPLGFFLPSRDYRRTSVPTPSPLATGLDALAHDLVGRWRRNPFVLRRLARQAARAALLARHKQALSEGQLVDTLHASAAVFRRGSARVGEESLLEALAALAVAAERSLGLFPHHQQLLAALALHGGFLIEMATGEGKSLCGCIAGTLAAWGGRPCHILTVNDYLAQRDAEELRPFYRLCGLSSAAVGGGMPREERRSAYGARVVYTTGKELLADFLRDRLHLGVLHHPARRIIRHLHQPGLRLSHGLVLRGLDTAIVDEADSVLIDEAVTPLIISEARENRLMAEAAKVKVALEIAAALEPGEHYQVDPKHKEIRLTARGYAQIEAATNTMPGIWRGQDRRAELVRQALTVRAFFHRDRQYVVDAEKVVIVDEYTGRLMPDRNWSHGLHQIVEAVEGLPATNPTETLASLSFQRFFRLFRRLSGMTGTATETIAEFWKIYRLPVITIPTHQPVRRKKLEDAVFTTEKEKCKTVIEEILRHNRMRRPVLIGTRSVADSERLAAELAKRDVFCNVLNAVRHREEARIITEAGGKEVVTIATNMAGRGTDIKLGQGVIELGGLHVIASERHDSERVDRQLFGRCARQGEPGSVQAFVSLDDEVLRRFLPLWLRSVLGKAVILGIPGARWGVGMLLARAQREAQRLAFRRRKTVLQMDTWLEEALFFSRGIEGRQQRVTDDGVAAGRNADGQFP